MSLDAPNRPARGALTTRRADGDVGDGHVDRAHSDNATGRAVRGSRHRATNGPVTIRSHQYEAKVPQTTPF